MGFINTTLLWPYVQTVFSEHVVNIWNSLLDVVDFDLFDKLKCSIKRIVYSHYSDNCF